MSQKSVLITGSSGYLGQHLTPKAAQRFKVYAAYHNHPQQIKAGHPLALNLTSEAEVRHVITHLRPQAIIHTAALNPGGDEALMWSVNVDASRYVAQSALDVGARLIHVSTDALHDGKTPPYDDLAVPTPLNLYGRSKAAAEAAVAEVNPQAVLVRTSLIYGLELMDRGTEGFVNRLQQGQPLLLFTDVIRQPIWVESLVQALLTLVDLDFNGTLNVAGAQALTREAYGRRMLAYWQVDTLDLLGIARAANISDTIPLDLRMTTHKAMKLLCMPFPGVDEVLTQTTS